MNKSEQIKINFIKIGQYLQHNCKSTNPVSCSTERICSKKSESDRRIGKKIMLKISISGIISRKHEVQKQAAETCSGRAQ